MTVRPNKNSQHEDTPMATPLLLQAEHVAKAYAGIPALRDGRLSLRAGSVHALCGGNGAVTSITPPPAGCGMVRRRAWSCNFRFPDSSAEASVRYFGSPRIGWPMASMCARN